MKKKVLCIFMALVMILPCFSVGTWAAKTNEFTVCDDSEECSTVPIYGSLAGLGGMSQTVIPGSLLESMAGKRITSVKFYLKTPSSVDYHSVFSVTVAATSMKNAIDYYGKLFDETVVYSGMLSVDNSEMLIKFNEPFSYDGGNLLIKIEGNSGYTNKKATFLGAYGYSKASSYTWDEIYSGYESFIPKTTFAFAEENDVVTKPLDFENSFVISKYSKFVNGIKWDNDEKILTLDNAKIRIGENVSDYALKLPDEATVRLFGDNTVSIGKNDSGNSVAVKSEGSLTFDGYKNEVSRVGKFNISSGISKSESGGISVRGNLTVKDCEISVTSASSDNFSYGVSALDLSVSGSDTVFTAKSGNGDITNGINITKDISVNDGAEVNVYGGAGNTDSVCLKAGKNLLIRNSSLNIFSIDDSKNQSKCGMFLADDESVLTLYGTAKISSSGSIISLSPMGSENNPLYIENGNVPYSFGVTEIIPKKTVVIKSNNRDVFTAYVNEKIAFIEGLQQGTDCEKCKELSENILNFLYASDYDSKKTFYYNKKNFDNVYSAMEKSFLLHMNTEKFEKYKAGKIQALERLKSQEMLEQNINVYSSMIDRVTNTLFDENLTLDENKNIIDNIANSFSGGIEMYALISEFESYKENKIKELDGMRQDDDSDVASALISVAQKKIKTTEFDEKSTLDNNKFVIDCIVSNFTFTLITQRGADRFDAQKKFLNDSLDALAVDGDDSRVLNIIEDVRNKINNAKYNSLLSAEDNIATLNWIYSDVEVNVAVQRLFNAVDAYKAIKIKEIENFKNKTDSKTTTNILVKGQNDISAYSADITLLLVDNMAKIDEICLIAETNGQLQRNKEEFETYKKEKAEGLEILKAVDDSENALKMIKSAQKYIRVISYADSLTMDENKTAVENYIVDLTKRLVEQRQTDAYEMYQTYICGKIGELEKSDDNYEVKEIISDAQKKVSDREYDNGKSLNDNRADLDDIFKNTEKKVNRKRTFGFDFISRILEFFAKIIDKLSSLLGM